MRRVILMLAIAGAVIYAVQRSEWWRTRYMAYDPHQKCLAVKPARECEGLRP